MQRLTIALLATLIAAASQAQTTPSAGPDAQPASALVVDPCPPTLPVPDAYAEMSERVLQPGKIEANFYGVFWSRPDVQVYMQAQKERAANDWPNLCKYRAANAALTQRPRVVFMGDSITEYWVKGDPALFSNGVIGRGIGGQTTPQMLLRFFSDVIALQPQVVHIMAGINDLAGVTGATTVQDFGNNITAMVELARAHHIRVVLASILPATGYEMKPAWKPASAIVVLNAWLRDYAAKNGIRYVDYYPVLADSQGGLKAQFANDGVHPNRDGYAAMKNLTLQAIGGSR